MRIIETVWVAGLCFCGIVGLQAEETVKSPLEAVGRQAGVIQEKRAPVKQWRSGEALPLTDQRITMGQWSKHFSSVGSKRAPIEMKSGERRTVQTERKTFPTRSREMSRMDQQMADIEREARIGKKDTPLLLRDHQVYAMMLQGDAFEKEMGKQLSLRDLNRFQFRRNRSDAAVPVKQAGSGER